MGGFYSRSLDIGLIVQQEAISDNEEISFFSSGSGGLASFYILEHPCARFGSTYILERPGATFFFFLIFKSQNRDPDDTAMERSFVRS